VETLGKPAYAYMPGLSSMAPYLTACREGVLLARTDYSPMMYRLDPAVYEEDHNATNEIVKMVKEDINTVLYAFSNTSDGDRSELAAYYASLAPDPYLIAIVADPYMVPWYYYQTTGQEFRENEGFGLPSDNPYADIDFDFDNPPFDVDGSIPSFELGTGRVTGWDAQDVSALMARTLFYSEITDSFDGLPGVSWKESAMNTFGSKVPVGLAKTVTTKLNQAWRRAGYTVDTYHDVFFSDRSFSADYYQRSNFIFFCAHGFFYWYVPPGYQKDGVGGGFDVAHVTAMHMGPSVMFGSSCVTGRTDGLPGYNTISQAYLHAGVNAYVGASRLSWGGFSLIADDSGEVYGDYLGLLLYGYLTGYVYNKRGGLVSQDVGNLNMGAALMMAKNKYVMDCGTDGGGPNDDTLEEFNLYGDPAFNPYEPNHNG